MRFSEEDLRDFLDERQKHWELALPQSLRVFTALSATRPGARNVQICQGGGANYSTLGTVRKLTLMNGSSGMAEMQNAG